MSLTQQFFAEGEIQEARAWKNSPLLFDETTEPEATKFRSFDRVPRRWTPIIIATWLVAIAAAGGAWAIGLWQPPPEVVTWAHRFDPRVIFTPTAPSAAALVNSTPAGPSAPRVEAATPPPVEAPTAAPTPAPAARIEAAAPAPRVEATTGAPATQVEAAAPTSAPGISRSEATAPAVPAAPAVLGPGAAAVAATADAPPVHAQSAVDPQPTDATEPSPGTVPSSARPAPSTPGKADATTPNRARPRPGHNAGASRGAKARHGYVWSDQRGNLVPVSANAETAAAAPDDTLPISADLPGDRAEPGSASARATTGSDGAPMDTEQPAPPQSPRRHPPTSSASASEPPPIPVPAIDPPKTLPQPTEMAAPSAP
jgi:hypothetical protein